VSSSSLRFESSFRPRYTCYSPSSSSIFSLSFMAGTRKKDKSVGEEKLELIVSSLDSIPKIQKSLEKYNVQLPLDWVVDVAGPSLRLNSVMAADDTRRIFYVKMFKYGLQLPLDPLMAHLLAHYDLDLAHLSPNAFCCVYAFLRMCRIFKIESPSLALFQSLFQLYSRKGVLGMGPRYEEELLKPFTWKIRNIETSVDNWKESYFVITLPSPLWRSGFNRDVTDGTWNKRLLPLSAEDHTNQATLLTLSFSVNTPKFARGDALDKCSSGKSHSIAFLLFRANTNADIF